MKIRYAIAAALIALSTTALAVAPTPTTKNVVLVHGAFADGSGWRAVATSLLAKGYQVTVVQVPETSFADDVKATTRVIGMQDGPVVLVGHSYGGAIITEAGNDAKVAALVYIAALQPDAGEVPGALLQKIPAAGTAIKPTADGFLYLDPAAFAKDFAADLPKAEAEFMARSQVFVANGALGQPITQAAWKTKPSWALVATDDRAINPELERWMSNRANSHTTEIKSSHVAYISHPEAVVRLIESAAASAVK